jgi:hypothetical protein
VATIGTCTSMCTADTGCPEKGGMLGACVDGYCYASCIPAADGGLPNDDAGATGDAGKVPAPCKDKAFACTEVDGHTGTFCVPGAGGEGGVEPADASGGDN